MARALSFNGLANAQLVSAINGGSHVAPAFAGHRLRLVRGARQGRDQRDGRRRPAAAPGRDQGRDESMTLRTEDGKYADGVLLDLDYWVFIPR
jgi:2-methylfumaryl-CoA hydratase